MEDDESTDERGAGVDDGVRAVSWSSCVLKKPVHATQVTKAFETLLRYDQ